MKMAVNYEQKAILTMNIIKNKNNFKINNNCNNILIY